MASGTPPRATLAGCKSALLVAAITLVPAACNPHQSALHPASDEAEAVATLFWVMAGGGFLIWLLVMGLAVFAVLSPRRPKTERFADRFTLIGGVIFPTVVLAALLIIGLSLLPSWTEDEQPDLRIQIVGEQYWWRVIYETAAGERIETANEVHLPVNATAEFVIESNDVIHSFWIPALGGKMDAIPGRTNLLRLTSNRSGVFRGVCAEFCGGSHALMAFDVMVHDEAEFAAWLASQAEPASAPPGAETFVENGCGACHTVRGVSEQGSIAPDLTHVGSRRTIAAGTLPNTPDSLRRWIETPSAIKPDARMPAYHLVADEDLDSLVGFLTGLR